MGAYALHQIKTDFEIISKGILCKHIRNIELVAERILDDDTLNSEARDMAIAHLLQSADMLACAHILSDPSLKLTKIEKGKRIVNAMTGAHVCE